MPKNESPQTNQTPPPTKTSETIGDAFKKYIPVATGIIVFGLITYWYGSHDTQRKLEFQVELNRVTVEKLVAAEKEKSEAQNQLVIAVAKLSEQQARLASDVKDMQQIQQRNTELLLNQKK